MDKITKKIADLLECEYEILPPAGDPAQILQQYEQAKLEGLEQGYTPVLIVPSEELFELLEKKEAPSYYLEEYKKHKGTEILEGFLQELKNLAEKYGEEWEDVIGEICHGEAMNEFISYTPEDAGETVEVILAKIPVKQPWEVFAWVPMGGWNDCPPTPYMMAIVKEWVNAYGFQPVAIAADMVEGTVPKLPKDEEEAMEIAQQQYAFAPDLVEQCCGDATLGQLADTLSKSNVWFFWWD